MTNDDIVTRLRAKESRDNRELLDEAAEEIEALRKQNSQYKGELDEDTKIGSDCIETMEKATAYIRVLKSEVANLIRARDAAIDRAKKLEQRLEHECYGE